MSCFVGRLFSFVGGVVGFVLASAVSHAAAPMGEASVGAVSNIASGLNARAEILINSYVGPSPDTFQSGKTVVESVTNAAQGDGSCAQVLINSATAFPCSGGDEGGGA